MTDKEQIAVYRKALMQAAGFVWQDCTCGLDCGPDERFFDGIGGEGSWYLKFLRDAMTDDRDWAAQYLDDRELQRGEELHLQGVFCECQPGAETCEFCKQLLAVDAEAQAECDRRNEEAS